MEGEKRQCLLKLDPFQREKGEDMSMFKRIRIGALRNWIRHPSIKMTVFLFTGENFTSTIISIDKRVLGLYFAESWKKVEKYCEMRKTEATKSFVSIKKKNASGRDGDLQ